MRYRTTLPRLLPMLALLPLVLGACTTVVTSEARRGTIGEARETAPEERRPGPLTAVSTVSRVLSGDTIVLAGSRVVQLAGIAAPRGSAPFAAAAQETLRWLLPLGAIVRVAYAEGSTPDAAEIKAWVWIPVTERLREHYRAPETEGYAAKDPRLFAQLRELPLGAGLALSTLLVRNGLAKTAPDVGALALASVGPNGTLVPYRPEANAKIRWLLKDAELRAKRAKRNVWSNAAGE